MKINLSWTVNPEYAYFCRRVKIASGIDLEKYKPHQMYRRLESYRSRKGIKDYIAFAKLMEKEPERLRELLDFLAINVSEFFRNPEQWKVLEEKIIPNIAAKRNGSMDKIRVWSAGCSSGQEAYSLACVLEENRLSDYWLLATDIDRESLDKARKGQYSIDEAKRIPERFLSRYFIQEEGTVRAGEKIRSSIMFQSHNLLGDPFPDEIDLILCRNVLIYFSDDVKRDIFLGFRKALRSSGFLFVGASETILNPRNLGFSQEHPFFYRKMDN